MAKKLWMILVALALSVATVSAWAQESLLTLTLNVNDSQWGNVELQPFSPEEKLLTTITNTGTYGPNFNCSDSGRATLEFSGTVNNNGNNWGWWMNLGSLTVVPAEGYIITRISFDINGVTHEVTKAPFALYYDLPDGSSVPHSYSDYYGQGTDFGPYGPTCIRVYGYSPLTQSLEVSPGVYRVLPGTSVSVKATANEDHYLVSWSNGAEVTNLYQDSTIITVNESMTLTANFSPNPVLTLAANNSSWGSVELQPFVPVEQLLTTITNTGTSGSNAHYTETGRAWMEFSNPDMVNNDGGSQGWWTLEDSIVVTPDNGFVITRVSFVVGGEMFTLTEAPFKLYFNQDAYDGYTPHLYSGPDGTGTDFGRYGPTNVTVYGYFPLPEAVTVLYENVFRFPYNTPLSILATANEHYHIDSWSNGVVVNDRTVDSQSFVIIKDSSITVNFAIDQFEVTATASPSVGGVVTGGGIYDYDAMANLTAAANEGYTFVNWTEEDTVVTTNPAYAFPVLKDRDLVANFSLNSYEITAVANLSAGGTVSGDGTYHHFDTCTLTATPATGYHFINWTKYGEVVSNSTTLKFMVTEAEDYTANFAIDQFTLTLVGNGNGSITVETPLPAGAIDNGDGTYTVNYGIPSLNVIASPDEHYYVLQVNDDVLYSNLPVVRNITVTKDTTFTATFAARPVLTLAVDYEQWGSVEIQKVPVGVPEVMVLPGNVKQMGPNTYSVGYGTEVTVAANAMALHFVNGWLDQDEVAISGATFSDFAVTEPTDKFPAKSLLTLTMTDDMTAKALFGINDYVVSANVAEGQSDRGSVQLSYTDGDGHAQITDPVDATQVTALGGTTTTLIAAPAYGYVFDHWTVGSQVYNTTTTTVTAAATATAHFGYEQFTITAVVADGQDTWGTVSGSATVDYLTSVTLTASQTDRYHFLYWTNAAGDIISTSPSLTVQALRDSVITAHFAVNPILTLTVIGDGIVELSGSALPEDVFDTEEAGKYSVLPGTTLAVAAIPATNHYMRQWNNEEPLNSNEPVSKTIIVDEDMTLSAVFCTKPVLSLATENDRLGSVGFDGSTLPVNAAETGTANTYYIDYGTEVTLEASSVLRHHVRGWEDEGQHSLAAAGYSDYAETSPENLYPAKSSLTFTVTGDTTAKVLFGINGDNLYDLTLSANNSQWGDVELQPFAPEEMLLTTITNSGTTAENANYGEPGKASLDFSGTVNNNGNNWGWWMEHGSIEVVPDDGYTITRISFVIDNHTYELDEPPFELYFYTDPQNGNVPHTYSNRLGNGEDYGQYGPSSITVYGHAPLSEGVLKVADDVYNVPAGTSLSVMATAHDGYYLASWSNGSEVSDLSRATTAVTIGETMSLTANFAANPTLTLVADGENDGAMELVGFGSDNTLDLSTITTNDPIIVEDGWTITGTLNVDDHPVRISIDRGASVILDNVTIQGVCTYDDDNEEYTNPWAGLTCLGDATINISGTNSVRGFSAEYPGIQAGPMGSTIVIQGTGSLTASTGVFEDQAFAAGIGTGRWVSCGSIVINSGDITAICGNHAYGIGYTRGEYISPSCGAIVFGDSTVFNGSSWVDGLESGTCGGMLFTRNSKKWILTSPSGGSKPLKIFNGVLANADGTFSVRPGTVLKVEATPAENFYMHKWNEDEVVNSNEAVVKEDVLVNYDDVTLTAHFSAYPVLTLATNNDSWGSVELQPFVPVEQPLTTITNVGTTGSNANYSEPGRVSLVFSDPGAVNNDGGSQGWWTLEDTLTVTPADGFVITRVSFVVGNDTFELTEAPFMLYFDQDAYDGYDPHTYSGPDGSGTDFGRFGPKFFSVYGYFPLSEEVTTLSEGVYRCPYGTQLPILATANENYHIDSWSNGVEVIDRIADSHLFTITKDSAITVNFAMGQFEVTAVASPVAGGTVTGNGIYSYDAMVNLTATANSGYTFINWTEEDTVVTTNSAYTFSVSKDRAFVANFSLNSYEITATANLTAGGSVSGGGTYHHFDTCTLTATPATGYHFVNWTKSGEEVSTSSTFKFMVKEAGDYTANFAMGQFEVTAVASPVAGGTVTGNGIYSYDAMVNLTATANSGYTFINWTEEDTVVTTNSAYTFSVSKDRAFVANFSLNSYEITATANLTAGGSVSGGGTYHHFDTCTLTATPATGYHFVNWTKSGEEVSTSNTLKFMVTGAEEYTANFAMEQFEVTAVASPVAGGTVTGSGIYSYDAMVNLTATANAGYTFVSWTEEDTVVTTNSAYTFSVSKDRAFVANFSLNSYEITATANLTEGGSVSGGGTYHHFDTCTLTATPATGYHFVNWTKSGDEVSTSSTFKFMVKEAGDYMANFAIDQYTACTSVKDTDNNVYPAVMIGNKCWMAANLRVTRYADGRAITNVYGYESTSYPNVDENVDIYGRLYDWYDATDASRPTKSSHIRGICPKGWSLPTEQDFAALSSEDLHALRSTSYWVKNNGSNSSGFNMKPAGMYNFVKTRYESLCCSTYFWSVSSASETDAHCCMSSYYCDTFIHLILDKKHGFSVRCVKD